MKGIGRYRGIRFALVFLLALPVAVPGAAATEQTLTLHTKDPATWRIIADGASGRLSFDDASGAFVFHGQGLSPRTNYVLIRHADDPATARMLAQGVTDAAGGLRLQGKWSDWTMKFWLVLADDLELHNGQGRLKAWHPQRYLFESKLLGVPCDCEE